MKLSRKLTLGCASALCFGLSLLLLTACTTTPQGKSVDRANYADIGSTALALTVQSNASELNPLGYYLLPLKLGMGYGIEQVNYPCEDKAGAVGILNTIFYGAAGNNLMVAAGIGLPYAPLVGVAIGIGYAIKKEDIEPETFNCEGTK